MFKLPSVHMLVNLIKEKRERKENPKYTTSHCVFPSVSVKQPQANIYVPQSNKTTSVTTKSMWKKK